MSKECDPYRLPGIEAAGVEGDRGDAVGADEGEDEVGLYGDGKILIGAV